MHQQALPLESKLDREYREWRATEHGTRIALEVRARALRLHARGVKHYGIGAIWESIRFDWTVSGRDEAGFKANNNHRSRLAREIVARHPQLAGFFEVRELRG